MNAWKVDTTSQQEELEPDIPPPYEPYGPPSYDEIVAVGIDNQLSKHPNYGKTHKRKRRSRSAATHQSEFGLVSFAALLNNKLNFHRRSSVPTTTTNTQLEVVLPPESPVSSRELPSSSLNPEHQRHSICSDIYFSRLNDDLLASCLLGNDFWLPYWIFPPL